MQRSIIGNIKTRLTRRRAPGPFDIPVIGQTAGFAQDQIGFCLRAAREYGDICRFRVAGYAWHQIVHPNDIYDVLVTRASLFRKPEISKRIFHYFTGNGLVSSDGDFWKRQHGMVKQGFHKKRVDSYGDVMVRYTRDLVDTFRDGEMRDICLDMTALALSIVAKTLFDSDVRQGGTSVIGDAMATLNEVLIEHIHLPLPVPKWWPSETNRRKHRAIAEWETIVHRIIDERRRSGVDRGDLLSMLIWAQSDTGERMNDKELRDEAMTLFFAGHETTAIALTWIWYLLARNPNVERKLLRELDTVLGGRLPGVSDLPNLPYLEMVVKESLRILPAVWAYLREPIDDVELGGYTIEKGSVIFINPFVTQRDPRFFDDPLEFRPERFSPENEKKIMRGAYVPFGAGPRICIGKAFAMMEARLVVATALQRLRFEIAPDFKLEFKAQLSLHPRHGMPLTVRLRARDAAVERPAPVVVGEAHAEA